MSMTLLSPKLIRSVQELLARRAGLKPESISPQSLEAAIYERSTSLGLHSAQAYWDRLRSDRTEVSALVERLVVPETWFLREPEALNILAKEAQQLRRQLDVRSQPLRILSAPCATGEEPLSIVMTLLDAGWSPESLQVVAVDISEENLTKAARGWFPVHSFRSRDLGFRERHFTAAHSGYQIHERVSGAVSWHRIDLVTQSIVDDHEPFDFIFCRNLFIYLRAEARRQVLDHLVAALKEDGGLFVGAAECGYLSRQWVHCERVQDAYVFRKSATRRGMAPAVPSNTDVVETSRIRSGRGPDVGSCPGDGNRLAANPLMPAVCSPRRQNPELERARCLADSGCLDEAATICASILKSEATSVETLHLMGVVRDAAGRDREAEALYRKAIYLDPGFYDAIMQLSLNRKRAGDLREAQMLQERARRLLASEERLP